MAWAEKEKIRAGVAIMLEVNLAVRDGEKVLVMADPPGLKQWHQLGLKVKADEAVAAPVCTCIEFPQEADWTELASTMLEEHGVALAAGFRIGNMGLVADPRCILPTISALELTMRKLGYDVPAGAGLEAARRVFAGATV